MEFFRSHARSGGAAQELLLYPKLLLIPVRVL